MTYEEKIDIISLRFDLLWYRIWLEFPEVKQDEILLHSNQSLDINRLLEVRKGKSKKCITQMDSYVRRKSKFEASFCSDGGKYLLHLINNTANGSTLWEIPKGHGNKKEPPLDVAIRECKEETGLSLSKYDIMYDMNSIIDSYMSSGIRYRNEYFIAYSTCLESPKNVFAIDRDSVREVEEIRWVSLPEVKYLDKMGHLTKLVKQIFLNIKYKYKIIANGERRVN
jgi:8-oxo-dGTP pyrophosphatase MutT (NUDIX family)